MNQAIEITIFRVATTTIALSSETTDIELKASTAGHEIA